MSTDEGKDRQRKQRPRIVRVEGELWPTLGITEAQYEQLIKVLEAKGGIVRQEQTPIVNMSGKFDKEGMWIVDSGCTEHITCYDSMLKNKFKKNYEPPVTIPKEKTIAVEGRGSCTLPNGVDVNDVLHIPKFKCNLLSISKLSRDLNCAKTFLLESFLMHDIRSGTLIGTGKCQNSLYKMEMVKKRHALATSAKFFRLPFPVSTSKTYACFDLIHCDIWGKYRTPSLTRAIYFLTIVDDFSRATWVYLLKQKHEASMYLKAFHKMVQVQFEKNIRRIRCDNGGEFISNQMIEFYANQGIILQVSQRYTKKLFEFLKKSHIYVALTNEPSTYYSQFLREFWYTAEADISSKSITFNLSHLENPLTFNLEVFSSVIGLKSSESFVNLPKKETVKEGLATLGLFDETKPSLTSFDLINSSPVKIKYFTPVWKVLMQYIVKCLGILFSDLIAQLHPETSKHKRKLNICYTRYLSLVMERLMKENYKNDKLLSLKPYKITFVTLRTPLENETPLTAHMCNVAEISPQPLQSLIPPSEEVNADDSADKSLSGISVQPVTQPKATTAKKPRKKTIPSSTRPEALNLSRIETSSSSQATHLQLSEELVVSADETKSLDVSESAGAQENQNETAEAEKVLNTNVEENMEEKEKDEDHSSYIPTVEQLLDKVDKQNSAVQHTQERPFDTESEILFVKYFQASHIAKDVEVTLMRSRPMDMDAQTADSEFKLESIPDDDLQSRSGFKTSVSDSRHDVSHSEHTSWEKTASTEFQSLLGHLDHVYEEVSLIYYKLEEMKSSIAQKVSDDIKSFVPDLISHSLKAPLPGLLSDALKNCLRQLLKESLTPLIPSVFESVAEEQA
ncbi:retrovirus-related pol polyprotein from transposon TNT 1-94 [Tanacetum coccineum]